MIKYSEGPIPAWLPDNPELDKSILANFRLPAWLPDDPVELVASGDEYVLEGLAHWGNEAVQLVVLASNPSDDVKWVLARYGSEAVQLALLATNPSDYVLRPLARYGNEAVRSKAVQEMLHGQI